VQRYRQDTRGNIMVLMALIIVAIMGLAGFAIDLRFTISQRRKSSTRWILPCLRGPWNARRA
jgi:Flp pilus assembly protein TadG